jgi:hypothetical protein
LIFHVFFWICEFELNPGHQDGNNRDEGASGGAKGISSEASACFLEFKLIIHLIIIVWLDKLMFRVAIFQLVFVSLYMDFTVSASRITFAGIDVILLI